MRKNLFALCFGFVLLWPLAIYAHELSPAHYPLGPLPILIASEMWLIVLMIPIVLAVETFVLQWWAQELGAKANLWRVAVLYIVARVAETTAYFSVGSIGPFFGWVAPGWTSSVVETFGSLLFCLIAGFISKLVVGWFLYRRSLTPRQITRAVGLATLFGYLSAVIWSVVVRVIM